MAMRGGDFVRVPPFEKGFERQGDDGEQRQQRCHRERADILVIVVKHFDMQRHGVGQAREYVR